MGSGKTSVDRNPSKTVYEYVGAMVSKALCDSTLHVCKRSLKHHFRPAQ